jgi:hypothetical protein
MRNLDQILEATAQGDTNLIRNTTGLLNLQKVYHEAYTAGPEAFAAWEERFTVAIPRIAECMATGAKGLPTGGRSMHAGSSKNSGGDTGGE